MNTRRITLVMEGLETDGGHVRLARLLKSLRSLNRSLSRLDSREAGGTGASRFVVVTLTHDSPAT
jgi:hypothetical protein